MTKDLPEPAVGDDGVEPGSGSTPSVERSRRGPSLKLKLIAGAVLLVLVVIAYFIVSRFAPQWWGTTIGNRVDGSFSTGVGYGLLLGVVGSALPIILAYFAILSFGRLKNAFTWICGIAAVLLTVPNLLTLSVVNNDTGPARAGRAMLDIHAMGFRGASLVGVIAGVLIGIAVIFYLLGRRRTKAKGKAKAKPAN